MTWLAWMRRKPSKDLEAATKAVEENIAALAERRSAIGRLVHALNNIPLDEAITGLSNDLTDVERNGH